MATDPWRSPEADAAPPDPRMVELTHLDPWSVGKAAGGVYGAMGVIGGLMMLLLGLMTSPQGFAMATAAFAFAAPIVYGVMGLIGGMIAAVAYNLVADAVGGIRFELR